MVRFFLRVLQKLDLLQFLNFTVRCTYAHTVYKIPIKGGVGFDHFGKRESWMSVLIKRLLVLHSGKSFLDVGVNIGQTLLAVKSINLHIPYYGLEPNPICIEYLTGLITMNNIDATIYPVGLSVEDGLISLYKDKKLPQDSSASIIRNFRDVEGKEQVWVPILTWDKVPASSNVLFGIVKIDVEGAEWEVISSLKKMISDQRPSIICEILPTYSADNVFRIERQEKILKTLFDLDYVLFLIKNDGALELLTKIEIHGDVINSNYLFLPSEHQTLFHTA